jgi:hypothetical protein
MTGECPQEFLRWLISRQALNDPPRDAGCEYVIEDASESHQAPAAATLKAMVAGASPHDD